MQSRVEKDFLGTKEILMDAYYGIQTVRSVQNFPITGYVLNQDFIVCLAKVKKAAALANMQSSMLNPTMGKAILKAAEEIIQGQWMDQFIVDPIQGGAGTSINMNMNEVLANRALELLGKQKGDYHYCSPNIHVNMSQSTNDVIPTALKMTVYRLTRELIDALEQLKNGLIEKAQQFNHIVKMGRTHLQDAVPIRLGQEFGAYAYVIERDIARIQEANKHMLNVNIGATAVGTGLNAQPEYMDMVLEFLSIEADLPLKRAENLVDATQNTDHFTTLSAALKILAVNLSKICNDLRLMASGPRAGLGEIHLQPRQPGSSIMPGKVNPVILEVVNQISFQAIGNDHTICLASEAGQFELNVMLPVLSFNLLQSLSILKNGVLVFYEHALVHIEANEVVCKSYVDNSFGTITALNPHLGYTTTSEVVREALQTGKTIKEICIERHLLTLEELDEIMDPYQMTTPGIAGSRFLG